MKQKHLFLLIFGFFISGISFSQNTLYVANNGSDSNSGTIDSPLKNIQTAINKMAAGDIIYLRGGVYREMVTAIKSNTSILAYPDETPIIKGSEIMTGWVAEGNFWKLPTKLINVQQVFVDGNNPLQQIGFPRKSFETDDTSRPRYEMPVGTGIGDMTAGRFWWDGDKGDNNATGFLYIWLEDSSDPNSHSIEVSQQSSVLQLIGRESYIKGVQIEHSNSNTNSEQGSAVSLGTECVMDSCRVQWCDFSGISLGNKSEVINSIVVHNGAVGISSAGGDDFLIKNTRMAYNNYRNFYSQWHTGGFKGATHAWGTIENCEIDNNNGAGVWFDYCHKSAREDDEDGDNLYPIIIRNNYFHNNGTGTYDTKTINNNGSILIEVSEQAFVYNNIIDTFEYRGIWVSSAWFSYFTNNVLSNGKSGVNYSHAIDGGASYVDWAWVKNNVIANNIIYNNNTGSDIRMEPEDGTKYANNICRNNLVYREGGPLKLKYGSSTKTSIEAWQNETPYGQNSISVEPDFADVYFHLANNSQCINTGYNVEHEIITSDYEGNLRKLGPFMDMGIFEEIIGGTDEYNATLKELAVSMGSLEPGFTQTNFTYTDTLPDNTTQIPVVTATPYNSGSAVSITNATNVQATDEADRTTTVTVTSESGVVEYTYKIKFYSKNTTGIDDLVNSNFKFYPNPSKGIVYVESSKLEHDANIEIMNIVGKTVKTAYYGTFSGRNKIDISDQPTGVYLMSIKSRNTNKIVKFTIQ
jgi:hypothetical protein